jgi:acetyl esterase/lipase
LPLSPRTRLLGWILPRLPGGTVAGASSDQIARMQQRTVPDTPITRAIKGDVADGVVVTEDRVPGAVGPLRARIYRPEGRTDPLPIIVHFHGGGWVLRDLEIGDWLCSRVAKGAEVVVVSIDYRLAPQDPFPAAVEDAAAATAWIAAHPGNVGGDGQRMAVMGDSAGANLAAVTAIGARDAGGPTLRLQVLLYPPTDLTGGSPSLTEDPDALILTPLGRDTFRSLYLGAADPADPRASPLLASDHAGLPPTLLQVGQQDPLRDDASRYAAALRAAGVEVRGTIYLDAVHGFLSFPGVVPAARQALWEIINEVRLRLHPQDQSR